MQRGFAVSYVSNGDLEPERSPHWAECLGRRVDLAVDSARRSKRLEASLICAGVKMSRLITIPGHDGRSLRSRQKDKVSMTFDSLRDFLAALDDNGQLLKITNEVAPEPDLGAAGRAVNELGENAPALLFENILGFEDARVALNVHGSWPNNALMLGLDKDTPVKAHAGVHE